MPEALQAAAGEKGVARIAFRPAGQMQRDGERMCELAFIAEASGDLIKLIRVLPLRQIAEGQRLVRQQGGKEFIGLLAQTTQLCGQFRNDARYLRIGMWVKEAHRFKSDKAETTNGPWTEPSGWEGVSFSGRVIGTDWVTADHESVPSSAAGGHLEPIKDSVPIPLVAAVPNVAEMNVVRAKAPDIDDVADFVKYAKPPRR